MMILIGAGIKNFLLNELRKRKNDLQFWFFFPRALEMPC